MPAHKKHGLCNSPEYHAWSAMRARCGNERSPPYSRYGGRGIVVCERWTHSFANFYADMGPRPSPEHSLDRFPDKNGNYERDNCRWATRIEQNRNKRDNIIVTAFGITQPLIAFFHIDYEPSRLAFIRTSARIKRSWNPEGAIAAPIVPWLIDRGK